MRTIPLLLLAAVAASGQVTYTYTGVLLSALPLVAPGIFELNAQHQAAALDVSSKPVGPNNPVQAGAAVSIYCTGLGPVNVAQTDSVPAPLDQLVYTTNQPTVTMSNVASNTTSLAVQ